MPNKRSKERSKFVGFYADEELYADARRRAKALNMTVADFMRRLVRDNSPKGDSCDAKGSKGKQER